MIEAETKAVWRLQLAALALLGVGLVLELAGIALPHVGFWHSDEGAKLLQLLNIRLGPSGLDTAISYPGRALDPSLAFAPFHPKQYHLDAAGGIHLQWPVFLALLTWPFYELLGRTGLYVLPLAGALAACWGSYRLARAVGVPAAWAWTAIPLVGLATPVGFYSLVFFEHTLAAGLVAAAVLLLVQGLVDGRLLRPFAAGLLLGAAIYLRSELYVLVPAVALVIIWRVMHALGGESGRALPAVGIALASAGTWLAGLVLALLPLWAFYTQSEGSPLPQHATWYFESAEAPGIRLPPLRYLSQAGLGIIPDFLAGPSGASGGPALSFWLIAALLVGACLVLLSVVTGHHHALATTDHARITIFVGLLLIAASSLWTLVEPEAYTSLHGFLLAAPLVAFAVLAWPGPGREGDGLRLLGGITALYIVLHLLVISALSGLGPISRYEWGQRYLLPAYPLLIALALRGFWTVQHRDRADTHDESTAQYVRRSKHYVLLATFCLLAVIGTGFLVRGWSVLGQEQEQVSKWQAAVASVSDGVLLTDDWSLPLLLAPEFYNHTWFLAPGGASGWPAAAARGDVRGFSTVTLSPALAARLALAKPAVIPGRAATLRGLTIQHFDLAP